MSSLMSEKVRVIAAINPASYAAGAQNSPWVSLAAYEEVMAIVQAGALGTNSTVDAKLQQAQDSSGTGAKDIASKAITQLTQAGSDKSNKQAVINARAEELDRNNGFTHVRLVVTGATAASLLSAVILGASARYSPGVQATSVNETIN